MSDTDATLPPENSAETDVNWEQRFKDTQSAFTKSQQDLAAERAVWDDEQAALQRLAERHAHLFEEEEDEPDEDFEVDEPADDPRFKKLDALEARMAQIDQERGETRFAKDLASEIGDRDLTETHRSWIKDRTAALGNNPKALKQAVAEFNDIVPAAPKPKPRAPHVLAAGQAASDVPDFSQMSRTEITKYMAERAIALSQQ